MKEVKMNNIGKQSHHLGPKPRDERLSSALRFLDGISRLPLENDPQRAEEIQQAYGIAKKREKN